MAFGAAARSAELGDLDPLVRLAQRSGQPQIRLAAARRLSALGQAGALEWLLADRLDPAVEAVVLAELLRAGHADVLPRLAALLRRHRFRVHQEIQLRYMMAAHGDASSRQRLYRVFRRDRRSWRSIEAAIALTALADPRGSRALRRSAGQRRRLHRTRIRAAAGLASVDSLAGRQTLGALAAPGTSPGLRLRAATVAVRLWRTVGPLARIAFDPQIPPMERGAALRLLADLAQGRGAPDINAIWFLRGGTAPQGPPGEGDRSAFPEPLRRRLAALAEAEATPARLRIAAAPLIPEERAAAVLAAIADGVGAPATSIRMAAIVRLDAIDGRAATTAFSRLLRDRRIPRLRRWWYAVLNSDLLAHSDAALLADRLGDLDAIASWRLVARALWLAAHTPDRILGQGPNEGTG